jgi:hypothetical protein
MHTSEEKSETLEKHNKYSLEKEKNIGEEEHFKIDKIAQRQNQKSSPTTSINEETRKSSTSLC